MLVQELLTLFFGWKRPFSYVWKDTEFARLITVSRLHQWLSSIQQMPIENVDVPYPKNITSYTPFGAGGLYFFAANWAQGIWIMKSSGALPKYLIRPTPDSSTSKTALKRRSETKRSKKMLWKEYGQGHSQCISRLSWLRVIQTVSEQFQSVGNRTFLEEHLLWCIRFGKKDFTGWGEGGSR